MTALTAAALDGLPEVRAGDDLAAMIAKAELREGDVVAVAHKIVSKAEGRVRALAGIAPSERAAELAGRLGKDPRHVQAVLDESREVLRAARGVLVCVTHHGFVCANAGVDASNVGTPGAVVLLPRDPDQSARTLRRRLRELTGRSLAVVITDTFGRAWRKGQIEVAIGCAGIAPLDDWRGHYDADGRELRATVIAVADQAAAAANLVRDKDSRQPVVVIGGLERFVTDDDGPGAGALVRPEQEDLFR